MKTLNAIQMAFYINLLVVSGLFSCSKSSDDPGPSSDFNATKYVIPAGSHETTDPLVFKTTTELKFRAKFDSSAIYTTVDSVNQYDTNKLLGLSDCGTSHLTNSARFGWRWWNNHLEIMAYCYIDGVRPEPQVVDTVSLGSINSYKISFLSDRYVFTINDSSRVEVLKNCNYNGLRYKLYPYFGGDETAPHEIRIWIQEQ